MISRVVTARTGICYCTQCRRQTGSPIAAFAAYRKSDLAPLSGQPEDEVDIFRGSFHRPGEIPVPTRQIWPQHRIPWVPEMTHIRTYLRSPRE